MERMCGICGMFRAENGGIGGILTTPGVCSFCWYFWHVLGREWRHFDHTRCLFFFFRQHEMSVLDGGFFGHASVRWRGLFLCF